MPIEYENVDAYGRNSNVKKHNVTQAFSKWEVDEYAKCMTDPAYFAINYCKVINLDEGLVPFNLYPYQREMFKTFEKNRFSIVLACRQSGKSISSVAYLLWYAIFKPSKTVAILANKGDTAGEMLSRITLMLENLPFFLQPGCKALNKRSIEFSNESKIVARSTSNSSIRGMSVNLLYLDEFAFVKDATEFYTSTYPVITSGKNTKVIITSTANGIGNIFHKIWTGAVQKTNEYVPFRVDWWDVPGRDEAWKASTIANTSQLQFDQEFGNCLSGDSTVIIKNDGEIRKISLKALYDAISRHEQDGFSLFEEISINSLLIDKIWVTYKIVNKDNDKFYIGKTSLDKWESGYMGSGTAIQAAVKKYGKNSFIRHILSYHENEDDAYLSEREILNECLHDQLCYNIAGGGKGVGSGLNHPFYGKPQSEESNKLRSITLTGQRRSKLAIENYKKSWTAERRAFQAALISSKPGTTSGKKLSDDHKKKISMSQAGDKNGFAGKTHRKSTCPHCGKTGAWMNMDRWHFNNCKNKK
jgi:hypothetical protein